MDYKTFKYIYPPRPEYIISPDQLSKYEINYLSQPKLNGTCCEIYIKGNDFKVFGRHRNENFRGFNLKIDDLKVLNCENNEWNVFVGEYMNKNQNGLDGKPWNHKFVIFDILVYNGKYLIGSSLEERIKILDNLFGKNEENEFLYRINKSVYRVKTFTNNFSDRWNKIIKIGMLEGLVLKKPYAKLERGLVEKNNTLWQLKSRKSTKNYRY